MNEVTILRDQIEWVGEFTTEQMKELQDEIKRMREGQVECVAEDEMQQRYAIQRIE